VHCSGCLANPGPTGLWNIGSCVTLVVLLVYIHIYIYTYIIHCTRYRSSNKYGKQNLYMQRPWWCLKQSSVWVMSSEYWYLTYLTWFNQQKIGVALNYLDGAFLWTSKQLKNGCPSTKIWQMLGFGPHWMIDLLWPVDSKPVASHYINLKKCVFIVATSLVMNSLENVKRLAKEAR